MKRRLFLLAPAALAGTRALAHGDAGHGTPPPYDPSHVEETEFGREGDPRRVNRTVRLHMYDTMRFTPARVTVWQGQTVRFIVHNAGMLMHEMVLGTPQALQEHAELMRRFPEMEHSEPHMAHVKPGASGRIVWQFTRAGEFSFACLQPGHFEAGMVGTILVKEKP